MKEKIAKLKKKKLYNRNLMFYLAFIVVIFIVFLFLLISYIRTYSDHIIEDDSHITDTTVYVNDYASDYYYYKGMNYVGDMNNNEVSYDDNDLVPVTITYNGHGDGVTTCGNNDTRNCGYVSLTETQYQFVYYKYFVDESGYINIPLIENPFSNRPYNKGFGGWLSNSGTITKDSNTNIQTLKVPVTYTSGKPNQLSINVYANWVDANIIWLDGQNGDDNFDGSFEDPVGSWSKAFQLLRENSDDPNNRETNIIVLKGAINYSINYSQSLTHTWSQDIDYTDHTAIVSGETYIIEYLNGNNRYALTDNNGNVSYSQLSTTVAPSNNTRWFITEVEGGFTIENYNTSRYLNYEIDGNDINLVLNNNVCVWKYDSTNRYFYVTVTKNNYTYSYTHNNTFVNNQKYSITKLVDNTINALSSDNNEVSNEVLDEANGPSANNLFTISSNGSGYTLRNDNNQYLIAQDNGSNAAEISFGTSLTYAVWNYDSANNAFYQSVRIAFTSIAYEQTRSFSTGSYYLTTGTGETLNAIGSNGTTTVTNHVLTTDEMPSDNALWTVSGSANSMQIRVNGYYLRNNNGTLQLSTNQSTNWTYSTSNGRISSRAGRYTYYLRFNNGTWSLNTSTTNAATIYLTEVVEDVTYQNITHYLSYNNGWTLSQNMNTTTDLTYTTYTEEVETNTFDYYLYYNNGFRLDDTNRTSLNFATYVNNRQIQSTNRGNAASNSNYTATTNVAATITSLYNGVDYRDSATITLTSANYSGFQVRNDLQLEYLSITANGFNAVDNGSASSNMTGSYAYLIGNYNNVRLGRGLTPASWTNTSSTIFCFAVGGSNSSSVGSTSNYNNEYQFTVESGRYSGLMAVRSRNDGSGSSYNYYGTARMTLGNDYDRVDNNNTNLEVYYRTASSNNYGINGAPNSAKPAYIMTVKSGNFGKYYFENNVTDEERAYAGIYVGGLTVNTSSTTYDLSNRVLIVEGGYIANIIGGLRIRTNEVGTSFTRIYVKDGEVGNIVGGAGVSTTYGDRFISVTGGKVQYSVSGGSNGYLSEQGSSGYTGQLDGDTYVHIGGTTEIGTISNETLYYVSSGSVLGAGNGNDDVPNSGCVNYANVFISGDAVIHGSVYGGGNYGNVFNNVNIQIDGGKVKGSVYGGPNQNGVGTVTINESTNTSVSYTDYASFTNGQKYLINYNNNGTRNALTGNNATITNTALSSNSSPSAGANWTINAVDGGYTLMNGQNRYLTAKPGVGSATLSTDISSEYGVWQYNGKTFYTSAEVITASDVTYTANTSFTSGNQYLITNTNTGTMYAITGSGSAGREQLSTTAIPSNNALWIITSSGSGYTIQNVGSGSYLSYTTGSGWNASATIGLSNSATVWDYDTTNRTFYVEVESWFSSSTYYLGYNNNTFSLTTTVRSLYFTTFTSVDTTEQSEFYLNYNNGWVLTTSDNTITLNYSTFSDTTRITVTATNKSYGNVTINMTNGEVEETIYGGSCLIGNVAGLVDINISGGKIGKSDEHNGSVYGGGYGQDTYVASGINLDITDTNNNSVIEGNIYGGSALGTIIGNINVNVLDSTSSSNTITLNDDLYCGGMGDADSSAYGNITGNCTLLVKGGTYEHSVYGGNNANGSAYGEITVTVGGDNVKTTVGNVYGGGNQADSLATSNEVYILSDSDITNVFGGGNEALVDTTYLYLNGGKVVNAYGGSNAASLTTSNVYLNGANATNIFGGSNQSGDLITTNITSTSGSATNIYGGNNLGGQVTTSNILINNGTITNTYGGGNLATVPTTNVTINNGNLETVFGGGNEAAVETSSVDINGGTITTVFGGGNLATVTTSDVEITGGNITTAFGGGNLASVVTSNVLVTGSTTGDLYGGGNEGAVNQTFVNLKGGKITNTYGAGNKAGVVVDTNITLEGTNVTNIYGGSNQSGEVPKTNITTTSGTCTTLYGGNNLGGKTIISDLTINGANITTIFGGGNQADTDTSNIEFNQTSNTVTNIYGGGNKASVTTTNVNFNGGSTNTLYGGSNQSGTIETSNININDGTITTLYGGNNAGGQTNTSIITTNGGTIKDIYGGGNNAVTGNTNLNVINNTTVTGNIYGGGNNAGVLNNTNINIKSSSIAGNLFGGGNNGTVSKDTYVNILDSTIGKSAYAGGNGKTAVVHGKTKIEVHGNSVINQHVFGGGNAANTGTAGANNSIGEVNIAGGKINGNVYGGANTAVLYGATTVNIGYNIVTNIDGTPVGSVYNSETNTYENREANINFVDGFKTSIGGFWGGFANIKNNLNETISNYTLVLYTGSNELTECYNCFYETNNGMTTITPRTDWNFTLDAGANFELQGTWNLNNPSEIYVVGYYTDNILNPVMLPPSTIVRGDIQIGGTVFGGGEANASGSDTYDFSFISVTTGITINIDAQGHNTFDIDGSIFGSGNASSTTGYSYINIDNYGTKDAVKTNVSLQRADLATLRNSHVEFFGATDRTNEYSSTLFSVSRITELKLKNNSSVYLNSGANLLTKFTSAVDINGEEVLGEVTINRDNGTFERNVDNRLYVIENNVVNIATNETSTAYGEVDGMAFFGMYKHSIDGGFIREMYDHDVKNGDVVTENDLAQSGSYVMGLHETNHNIKIDGFYTNYTDEENGNKIYADYIDPTPDDAIHYMWVVGIKPVFYDVTLEASKYATLGIKDLLMYDHIKPNTTFTVTGFNYDGLDPNAKLIDSNDIPRIAGDDFDVDNTFGLAMKTGTGAWITIGETNFYTNAATPWTGTSVYEKENSALTPNLVFYLYHAKNIKTAGVVGTVVVSVLAVTPIDDLTNKVELININISISRLLFPDNNYEATMTSGRQYEMFSSSKTDITTKSSLSAYYSLFVDGPKNNIYRDGYHRTLVSSFVLPVNTRITMIDLAGDKPEYYYYIVSSDDYNEKISQFNQESEATYDFSKFVRMGSLSENNRYDDLVKNDLYYDESLSITEEEFIFIVDFFDSNINENKLENTLMIEMRNADDETIYTVLNIQHGNLVYNLYNSGNAVVEVDGELNTDVLYVGEQVQLTVTTDFLQKTDESNNTIYDTTFHDQKLGIKITLFDENNIQVNGVDMMGISFKVGKEIYYPRSDGEIRIPLAERVANLSSKIIIDSANSNLSSAKYTIHIESFYSPDGIYYGLESSDSCDVELDVYEKLYGLDVSLDDNMLIIDKDDGTTIAGTNKMLFNVKYSGGLKNPNIKVIMYRRNYDEVYDTDYTVVDINDYLVNPLKNKYQDKTYTVFTSLTTSQSLLVYMKENIKSGTYKIEFRLYDNNAYIGEMSKYIVIR